MIIVVAVALVLLTWEALDPVDPITSASVEPLLHIEVPSVKLRKTLVCQNLDNTWLYVTF